MRWTRRTMALLGAALAAAALLVGTGVAIAASGDDKEELSGLAERIRAKDAFTDAVAKRLGVTAAKLEQSIVDAANARIDAAAKAGSISAADADVLREAVASGDHMALRIAQGADVAKALGVTEEKLDEAYAAEQKARALARVDEALEADRITKTVADELKARIEQAEFPGFGAGGPGHRGHGFGPRGDFGPGDGSGPMGKGFGHHGGFGPGFGGGMPPSDGATTPAVFA